jgi:hypothetical protein
MPSPEDWDLTRKGYYTSSGGEYNIELQRSGQASRTFKGSVNDMDSSKANRYEGALRKLVGQNTCPAE